MGAITSTAADRSRTLATQQPSATQQLSSSLTIMRALYRAMSKSTPPYRPPMHASMCSRWKWDAMVPARGGGGCSEGGGGNRLGAVICWVEDQIWSTQMI
jgi:hypothetical protein